MRDIERRVQKIERRQIVGGDYIIVEIRKDESESDAFLRTCNEENRLPEAIKYIALLPADMSAEEWQAEFGR